MNVEDEEFQRIERETVLREALAEQPAQHEPVGWKLMPRDATDAMLKAMDECSTEGYDERLYAGHAASVYMAAWDAHDTAYRPSGLAQPEQEPEFFTHCVDQPYDWSEWVCPDPKSYLMKCCDCGLVHEAEFGVVRYKSDTDREDCDRVDDPNLQAVFRMRRSEQWSPADMAHRAGGLTMEQPAQRTWVGLTDEEIAQGNKESWVTEQAWQSAVWWAEAKLKEKNMHT